MDQGKPPVGPDARTARFDRILFVVLAILVLAIGITVTLQMLKPSNRRAVTQSLVQDGLAIISASQSFVANMPAGVDTTGGPFSLLRFDRIGYLNGLAPDALTMTNEHGRFALEIAPDGSSFNLNAVGPDGISVTWEGIGREGVPEPKMK